VLVAFNFWHKALYHLCPGAPSPWNLWVSVPLPIFVCTNMIGCGGLGCLRGIRVLLMASGSGSRKAAKRQSRISIKCDCSIYTALQNCQPGEKNMSRWGTWVNIRIHIYEPIKAIKYIFLVVKCFPKYGGSKLIYL